MVQFSNRSKLSQVRKKWYNTQTRVKKRWYNTETVPKPVNREKKDGIILKESQNLSLVIKRCKILKQNQNLPTVKIRWCNSQAEQNCHQSEKDGTILKQCQNLITARKKMVQFSNRTKLSPLRKKWYNTQTEPKPVTSQEKM